MFNGAQKQLRAVFGMEMVELPTKDRNLMSATQKRKGKHPSHPMAIHDYDA